MSVTVLHAAIRSLAAPCRLHVSISPNAALACRGLLCAADCWQHSGCTIEAGFMYSVINPATPIRLHAAGMLHQPNGQAAQRHMAIEQKATALVHGFVRKTDPCLCQHHNGVERRLEVVRKKESCSRVALTEHTNCGCVVSATAGVGTWLNHQSWQPCTKKHVDTAPERSSSAQPCRSTMGGHSGALASSHCSPRMTGYAAPSVPG